MQWMGAVRVQIQTADKHHNNPQDSSTSIKILHCEKLCVCKKTNIYNYHYRHFCLKYQ